MKFGVFNWGMWHESKTQQEVLNQLIDDAVIADHLGYDTYWIGEHHFSRHGIVTNTLLTAAAIAVKTERIEIGTAVIVLPLNDPVRVAEETAAVDLLSGGRLRVGIGAGYQRQEFEGLGIDIDTSRGRFAEALDVLVQAWVDDSSLTYHGKFFNYDDLRVYPTPLQKPHPPLHVALTASPETIELAARRGLPLLVGGPTDLMGVAPQVIERWQIAMRRYGFSPDGIDIPCAKGIYVAPSDEEALADIDAADKEWDLRLLGQIGSPISRAGDVPPGYEHWTMRQQDRQRTLQENTQGGTARLIGSPATVAERVAELCDMGITSIFGTFGLPGMPHEKIVRALELFGKEVMPRFTSNVQLPGPAAEGAVDGRRVRA
jgi:alkanesulfonate monooxygenase SsuD/methylene tetrahydromethanopterin reductase-like flavin-dependent oxidoreductase (luciferase family)